mgnify:CR=1 FL=1
MEKAVLLGIIFIRGGSSWFSGTHEPELIAAKTAVNCYRKALSTWDGLHRQEGITEQNLLTIAVELRRTIANCPGI